MKNKNNKLVILLCVLVLVIGILFFRNVGGQTREVDALIGFVDSAGEHLRLNGTAALKDFRDPAGAWIEGDNYIFVYDMDGKTLVLPPQSNLEGTSRILTADPKGERYVETMVDILQFKTYGWNTYQYAKPNSDEVTTKLSYFKRISNGGKNYIVGSGIYLDK